MTIERAIKVLKDMVPKTCKMVNGRYVGGFEDTECPQFEAIQVAVEAIQKQMPKKVNISLKGTTDWNTKCHCPNCHSMVSHGKYCSNCGQALDFNSNGSDIK